MEIAPEALESDTLSNMIWASSIVHLRPKEITFPLDQFIYLAQTHEPIELEGLQYPA